MMFDELDQLKSLTRSIELEAIEEESIEPDLGATVVDATMDNRKYINDEPVFVAHIKPKSQSSGTPSKVRDVLEPIFEKTDEEPTEEMVEGMLSLGLGKGAGASLKKEFTECCDVCSDEGCKYNVGDVIKLIAPAIVKPSCSCGNECTCGCEDGCCTCGCGCDCDCDCDCEADDPMVLLIVKSTDGPNITAAKPTRNPAELSRTKDGCWPEFVFSTDEIGRMEGVTKNDVYAIMDFNDSHRTAKAQMESTVFSDAAMKKARQGVEDNQVQRNLSDKQIKNRLDEIFGGSIKYTSTAPTVVTQDINGKVSKIGGTENKPKVVMFGSSALGF